MHNPYMHLSGNTNHQDQTPNVTNTCLPCAEQERHDILENAYASIAGQVAERNEARTVLLRLGSEICPERFAALARHMGMPSLLNLPIVDLSRIIRVMIRNKINEASGEGEVTQDTRSMVNLRDVHNLQPERMLDLDVLVWAGDRETMMQHPEANWVAWVLAGKELREKATDQVKTARRALRTLAAATCAAALDSVAKHSHPEALDHWTAEQWHTYILEAVTLQIRLNQPY